MTFDRFKGWAARARAVPVLAIALVGGAAWLWAALAAWPTAPTIIDPQRGLISVLAGVGGVVGALAAVMGSSVLLARWPVAAGLLAHPGRLSLQIYLCHVLFTAGTRVVLVRGGVEDPAVHLALGTVAGVVGPLLLERTTRGVPWLFAPPWTGPAGVAARLPSRPT